MGSKVKHYAPSGQLAFCRQEGHGGSWVEMTPEDRMREVRACSTDLRRVTCPKCLVEMARCMVRKGVPVVVKRGGAA